MWQFRPHCDQRNHHFPVNQSRNHSIAAAVSDIRFSSFRVITGFNSHQMRRRKYSFPEWSCCPHLCFCWSEWSHPFFQDNHTGYWFPFPGKNNIRFPWPRQAGNTRICHIPGLPMVLQIIQSFRRHTVIFFLSDCIANQMPELIVLTSLIGRYTSHAGVNVSTAPMLLIFLQCHLPFSPPVEYSGQIFHTANDKLTAPVSVRWKRDGTSMVSSHCQYPPICLGAVY